MQSATPPHMIFRSQKLQPSCLSVIDSDYLCQDFIKGFCRNGIQCPQSHETCLLRQVQHPPAQNSARINQLNVQPRVFPRGTSPFDDDAPGDLSLHGPRHDNDFVDITDIRILPTADEMLSRRPPYMPRRDFESYHRLSGAQRLLDTLFRQLRYDSTEILNDANYDASQRLVRQIPIGPDYDERTKTAKGSRYRLYRDVRVESTSFHQTKGLCVRVSFACPFSLRGPKLGASNQLEDGRLITLVGLCKKTQGLSTTHMEIVERQSTKSMNSKTGNDTRAAVLLSFVADGCEEDVRRMLYNKGGLLNELFVMVEVPGTLYAGFRHTLQTLKDQYLHNEKFGFRDLVAPEAISGSSTIPPPSYTNDKDFVFNIECLNPQTLKGKTLSPRELLAASKDMESFVRMLLETTTLDKGQARAICESLCRRLAFIQGAPGAGKTYLGVELTKILLASQKPRMRRPILVTALTNHALDSFLADILGAGVTRVVRLGSKSRQQWTKEYDVNNLEKKTKKTSTEWYRANSARYDCESLWKEGTSWSDAVNSDAVATWPAVREHLAKTDVTMLCSFSDLEMVDTRGLSDLRLARRTDGFAFEHWRSGGDIDDIGGLITKLTTQAAHNEWMEESGDNVVTMAERRAAALRERVAALKLTSASAVWALSSDERAQLRREWAAAMNPHLLFDKTAAIQGRYQAACRTKCSVMDERHLKILKDQQIIAMTTTVAAREWKTLNNLGIFTAICEEAAEIGEASFLSSILPGLLHCICLGDPLQLRPMVKERALSIETDIGSRYRLDVSLMERLMMPSDPVETPIQASKLLTQRRMHPEIAELLKITHYPHLENHEDVEHMAPAPGLVERVSWLDHSEPENVLQDPAHPTSYNNAYEVGMVTGLVEFLISSGEYNYQDITILTPYNGQLAAFHASLRIKCPVSLNDQDREALHLAGYLSEADLENVETTIEIGNMLRLATVDNFQGEESRLIILSLVRSNPKGQVGFLKTPNRINVAISRARNGFFIIGNAIAMANGSNMWRIIIRLLAETGRLHQYIHACCTRHSMFQYRISRPLEWDTISDCVGACNYRAPVDLFCMKACHAGSEHLLGSKASLIKQHVSMRLEVMDEMFPPGLHEDEPHLCSTTYSIDEVMDEMFPSWMYQDEPQLCLTTDRIDEWLQNVVDRQVQSTTTSDTDKGSSEEHKETVDQARESHLIEPDSRFIEDVGNGVIQHPVIRAEDDHGATDSQGPSNISSKNLDGQEKYDGGSVVTSQPVTATEENASNALGAASEPTTMAPVKIGDHAAFRAAVAEVKFDASKYRTAK